MSGPTDLETLLSEWWGGGVDCSFINAANTAANISLGGNPKYQLSDFLAIYPKFGSFVQALSLVGPNATTPGSDYSINDLLSVTQEDASGGVIQVTTIDGNGAPTSYAVSTPGTGYSVASGLVTSGGSGMQALIDILSIAAYDGLVPQIVLQMYINLALASLQFNRWADTWLMGVSLYVAHFATLYLRSEGNPGSTAGQVAVSGLTKGIAVSKSAGDVSVGIQIPSGLDGFGAWTETEYGIQLATFAKIIGMGPMYIY